MPDHIATIRSILCSTKKGLTVLGLAFLLGSFNTLLPTKDLPQTTWLTIFVHGMMSIKPHLSCHNLVKFLSDDVQNCLYTKSVDIMRKNDFFFKNQAMQSLGLKKIDLSDTSPGNASSAMGMLFNYLYSVAGGTKFINHYYTFGWSGLLSATARYEDAKIFFNALTKEVAEFHRAGIYPKIRIIGYSHGGNVTLNLAAIRRATCPKVPFRIDETIFVGIPIQKETDFLINDPLFERIYNLYSHADRVQPLDLFSSKSFFSKRVFTPRCDFSLPSKLFQIELRVTRCSSLTKDNPHKECLANNLSNYGIATGRSRFLRSTSPGHTELWFFGWTPRNYRQNFVLYPLPAISVIPFITNYFDHHPSAGKTSSFICDVRPDFGTIIIKDKQYPGRPIACIDFLDHDQFSFISNALLERAPKSYLHSEYQQQITDSFEQAKKWQEADDVIKPTRLPVATLPRNDSD